MNNNQKIVLCVATVLVVCLSLFVPWKDAIHNQGNNIEQSAGYALIEGQDGRLVAVPNGTRQSSSLHRGERPMVIDALRRRQVEPADARKDA